MYKIIIKHIDDIIYATCLLICIGAGKYFKKIRDESQRKLLGTSFGLLLVFLVSGWQSFHCLISAAIGGAAVIYIHPSKCHLAVFFIMFGYLMFFRLADMFGFSQPYSHTNMIQMILTLKVAGVGFEKTAAWKKLQQRKEEEETLKKPTGDGQLVEISDYDVEIQSISMAEIFHYCFNYIGVLTGPYYRYRTYRDYFETPFKDYAPNIQATVERLKSVGIYCVFYLVGDYFFPLNYARTDEFYNQRSFLYRLMYIWPLFFVCRMRMYTGMILSECVCTMASFGAYPDESDVTNGEGPKKQYQHLKRDAEKRSYNFTTIVNIRVKGVEKSWTFRECAKHWNICVQYWLAVNVYKLFPSKKYRIGVTFICSAYWHGFRPGHYFCLMIAPVYIVIEDIWNKLVRKDATGLKRQFIDVIFWIFKFFSYSYLNVPFGLASFGVFWKYYNSIYHIGYITWALLFALGTYLIQQKKSAEKQRKHSEKKFYGGDPINMHKEKVQ